MGVDGPVFPSSANKFGTVRVKGMSQEHINQPFTYPSSEIFLCLNQFLLIDCFYYFFLTIDRPNVPPPKPPGTKAPPPRPIKSVSNSNLSNLPLSLGLGGDPSRNNNVAITNAQSETHLAIMNQISYSPHRQPQFEEPPPLPPHRNPPAPPRNPPTVRYLF